MNFATSGVRRAALRYGLTLVVWFSFVTIVQGRFSRFALERPTVKVFGLEVDLTHAYSIAPSHVIAHNTSARLPDFGDDFIEVLPGESANGYQGATVRRVGRMFVGRYEKDNGVRLVEMPIHRLIPIREEVVPELVSALSTKYAERGVEESDLVVGLYAVPKVVAVAIEDRYYLVMGIEHVRALIDLGEGFVPLFLYDGKKKDRISTDDYEAMKLAALRIGQDFGVFTDEFVNAHVVPFSTMTLRQARSVRLDAQRWYRRSYSALLSSQQNRSIKFLGNIDPFAFDDGPPMAKGGRHLEALRFS